MASKVDKENFSRYLAEAKSWETDKVRSLEKSRKLAWIVAGSAGVITFLSVIALAMLAPLKTSVPYVVRVDNATGAVDIVSALTNSKTNYGEVMNKYNVQWYVRWREGYSKNLIGDYYKNVGVMSAPQEQSKYSQWISRKNPDSPLNHYGDSGNVTVTIKSTSFLKDNIALVRYTKDVKGTKDVIATPHAGVTQQFMGDQATSLSGGVRIHNPHMIDKTTGVALDISAGSGNLRGKDPGWNVGATVEVTFNNAEAKKESPLEQAFMHATGKTEKVTAADISVNSLASGASTVAQPKSNEQYVKAAEIGGHAVKPSISMAQQDGHIRTTIEPKAQQTVVAAQHADTFDFLKLSHKDQVVVVNRMTENYVKEHPDVGREDAREAVVHSLLNPQRDKAAEMSFG